MLGHVCGRLLFGCGVQELDVEQSSGAHSVADLLHLGGLVTMPGTRESQSEAVAIGKGDRFCFVPFVQFYQDFALGGHTKFSDLEDDRRAKICFFSLFLGAGSHLVLFEV